MKKYKGIVLVFIILILIRCVEEPEPKSQEYPIFQTSVGKIDDSGVTLSIKTLNIGSGAIKRFGFLLGKEQSLDFNTCFDYSFEEELGDTFSARLSSNLSPDVQYEARAYVLYEADTIFGNAVAFTSLGSLAPVITDFFPVSGLDGDTITIVGSNFSTSVEDVSVSFGDVEADIISTAIEEIKAIVPKRSSSGITTINLAVFDDQVLINGFKVTSPTIEDISPDSGIDGTEVTITGTFSKISEYNLVWFNGINAQIIENSTHTLKVISPISSHVGQTDVIVEVNDKNSNTADFYTIGPVIESVAPLQGQYKDVVSIEGLEFDVTLSNNIVTFNGAEANILSATAKKLEVEVPNITSGSKHIRLQIGNKVVDFDQQFDVNGIWRDGPSFSGEGRRSGVSFSMNGKGYIGLGIDALYSTSTTISGKVFSDLWEFDPVSNSWTRKSDFPGKARYYASSFVINNFAYVGIGLEGLTGNSCCDDPYRDFYKFDPASNTWSRIADFPTTIEGYDIGLIRAVSFSVNGKGYVGAGTTSGVSASKKYSFYEYDPDLDQWNEIANPGKLGVNDCGFSYDNRGYVLLGSELWQFEPTDYSWTRLADYPVAGSYGSTCFVIGDHAYVGSGAVGLGTFQKNFYKYNFALDEWTEIQSLDALEIYEPFGFAIDDKGYVVCGTQDNWPYTYPQEMYILEPDQ
ncbi:IPT/TIG domain-containing protein [Reichenbachiella sp.]